MRQNRVGLMLLLCKFLACFCEAHALIDEARWVRSRLLWIKSWDGTRGTLTQTTKT